MINHQHPHISMQVFHTVLYTFLIVITSRISLTNLEDLEFVIISYILITLLFDSGMMLLEEVRCLSLSGLKVRNMWARILITLGRECLVQTSHHAMHCGIISDPLPQLYVSPQTSLFKKKTWAFYLHFNVWSITWKKYMYLFVGCGRYASKLMCQLQLWVAMEDLQDLCICVGH